MLRARDFDHVPSDLGTQKRRLRRQRFMETALPCAIIAALVVAAVFTVGHVGANARASIEHTRLLKAQMMLNSESTGQHAGSRFAPLNAPVAAGTQHGEQQLGGEAAQPSDAADARETAAGRAARAGAKRAAHAEALEPGAAL